MSLYVTKLASSAECPGSTVWNHLMAAVHSVRIKPAVNIQSFSVYTISAIVYVYSRKTAKIVNGDIGLPRQHVANFPVLPFHQPP